MCQKIIRYMSLPKFVSFLKDGLFVPKSTSFVDKWEGMIQLSKIKQEKQENYKEFCNIVRPWIYVSCWHKSEYESYAMWKIYGGFTEAVAIETTTNKLKDAYLKSHPSTLAYLDEVRYINPDIENEVSLPSGIVKINKKSNQIKGHLYFPILLLQFLKHIGYVFEKEVRLVCLDKGFDKDKKNKKQGIIIDHSSVMDFLESVLIFPESPPWFKNIVSDLLKKYGYDIPIKESTLSGP